MPRAVTAIIRVDVACPPEIGGVDEGGAGRVKFGDEGIAEVAGRPFVEKDQVAK
jgi:hypothetical protein